MNILKFEGWDMIFLHVPGWLILLVGAIVVALMIWYAIARQPKTTASVRYSDISLVKTRSRSLRQRLRPLLSILRILAVAFLFVAMARPQAGSQQRDITAEGIDIVLALDISSSMKAEDFKPHNRLYVAKEEIESFIQRRTNDRIGLVVFARAAFTQCPLTLDYGILRDFLAQVNFGQIEDGTAIGLAVASSVNRLKNSEAKSKVIVLLTDGVNNVWEIDPVTAANIAETMGIKVYTIGVGKTGNVMMPVDDPIFGKRYVYVPSEIDEETLQKIADVTGGMYFRARSGEELNKIYEEIDRLEKTKIEINEYIQYRELFFEWLLAGFALLIAEIFLGQTWLRKIP